MRRDSRAFTLVELLVTIGIVLVLVAIIVPTFTRAKGMAERQSCAASLMNWTRAMSIYCSDHTDQFPIRGPRRSALPSDWISILKPYVGMHDGPRCPQISLEDYRKFMLDLSIGSRPYIGYALNQFIGDNFVKPTDDPHVIMLTEVVAFEQITGDTRIRHYKPQLVTLDFINYQGNCAQEPPRPNIDYCGRQNWGARRHLGGANVSYLDGRIKWQVPESYRLFQYTSTPGVFTYSGPQNGPRFHPEEPIK